MLFVDTGLMRANEVKTIKKLFVENFKIKLDVVNSSGQFLKSLMESKIQRKNVKLLESNL